MKSKDLNPRQSRPEPALWACTLGQVCTPQPPHSLEASRPSLFLALSSPEYNCCFISWQSQKDPWGLGLVLFISESLETNPALSPENVPNKSFWINVSLTHNASSIVCCKDPFPLTEFLQHLKKKKTKPNNSSTFYNGISTEPYIFIALLMLPRIFISLWLEPQV